MPGHGRSQCAAASHASLARAACVLLWTTVLSAPAVQAQATPTATYTATQLTPTVSTSEVVDCSNWDKAPWFEKSCRQHLEDSSSDALYCLEKLFPTAKTHEHDSAHDAEVADGEHAPYTVLVLFGTFAVGALARYLFQDTILPFTVIMFLSGVGFGLCGRLAGEDSSWRNYMLLADMNPHLILYTFLPVLIFESAFAMEIPIFKKVVVQCALLATPGLIIATALTGYFARFLNDNLPGIHYNWPIEACFLFGTILSATDPVAVVALLKELGASKLVSTMIEGESLFNDGTAIVFFNVLIKAVERESCTVEWTSCGDQCLCDVFDCTLKDNALDVLLEFLRVSCGGLAIGFLMGVILVLCLERVFNDTLVEITLTLTFAYITFYVCEGFGTVSGVLGLVALGCMLSKYRQCISPEVEHTLHEFWEMAAFLTNASIFALAGMIVALKAIDNIVALDVAYLLLTYVCINVVRVIVLLFFLPVINSPLFEYKMTWRTFLLVAWGGLRGAVGLSLALVLRTDNKVVQPHVKDKIMFHTAGIVLLTLLVNAVSCRFLVAALGLNAVDLRRKLLMRDAFERLQSVSEHEVLDLRREPLYYDCNWRKVEEHTDLLGEVAEDYCDPYNKKGENIDIEDSALLAEHNRDAARLAYLHLVRSSVHKQYAAGQLSPHTVRALGRFEQAVLELDTHAKRAAANNPDGFILTHQLTTAEVAAPKFGLRGGRLFIGKSWFALAFEAGIGYVNMHRYAQKTIHQIAEKEAANHVEKHCKKTSAEAVDALGDLVRQDPDLANFARAVRTRHAVHAGLLAMKKELHHMQEEGRLDDEDKEALNHILKKRQKKVARKFPEHMNLPEAGSCLGLASWYEHCEPDCKMQLNGMVKVMHFKANVGESFLKEVSKNLGRRSDSKAWQCPGLFVIVTGVVQLRLGRKMYNLGAGFTLGLQSMICDQSKGAERFSEVFAETDCTFAFLDREALQPLFQVYPFFTAEIWKAAGQSAAYLLIGMEDQYAHWSPSFLRRIVKGGYCEYILDASRGEAWDSEKRMKIPEGSISVLLKGKVWEFTEDDCCRFPQMLPPGFKYGTFTHHAVVFFIPEEVWGSRSTRALQRWGRLKSKIRSIGIWSGLRGPDHARNALALAFKRSPPVQPAVSASDSAPKAAPPLLNLPQAFGGFSDGAASEGAVPRNGYYPGAPSQASAMSPFSQVAATAPWPGAAQQPQQQQQLQQQQPQQQQQQQPAAAPAAAAAASPVAADLPETPWVEARDEKYKRSYYWNKDTGARQWREPEEHATARKRKEAAAAGPSASPSSPHVTKEDLAAVVRQEIRDALASASVSPPASPLASPPASSPAARGTTTAAAAAAADDDAAAREARRAERSERRRERDERRAEREERRAARAAAGGTVDGFSSAPSSPTGTAGGGGGGYSPSQLPTQYRGGTAPPVAFGRGRGLGDVHAGVEEPSRLYNPYEAAGDVPYSPVQGGEGAPMPYGVTYQQSLPVNHPTLDDVEEPYGTQKRFVAQ